MTMTTTEQLQLFTVKPGMKFPVTVLKQLLPTSELALWFGKLYKLDARQLGGLLSVVSDDDVVSALTKDTGIHSHELQDYVVELGYEWTLESGAVSFEDVPEPAGFLPELWESAQVTIAESIQEVADKIKDVVGAMPGKQGEMVFRSLMTVNAKRPVLGDYKAHIHHGPQLPNLIVFDVSGSMSEHTVETIVADVVNLAYMANAHLAVVSDTATHWGPGEFSVDTVLNVAEYSGTHYEQLAPLFEEDWGVVVTIADYDSSYGAKPAIAAASGSIEQVLDISLVDCPTFLAECVGQLAKEVRPLLVAADHRYLTY